MFNQISKLVLSLPAVAVLLLSGCGGGEGTNVQGGSITINPESASVTVGGIGPCDGSLVTYRAFSITLNDQYGRPVDGPLSVILDWSSATTIGGNAMILYDDPAWLVGSSTPPTNAVSGTYTTNTGSGGTKRLIVGMDLSCGDYTGYLYASSDYGLFAQSELSVTVEAAAP